jgi:hypothetical protein
MEHRGFDKRFPVTILMGAALLQISLEVIHTTPYAIAPEGSQYSLAKD